LNLTFLNLIRKITITTVIKEIFLEFEIVILRVLQIELKKSERKTLLRQNALIEFVFNFSSCLLF